MTNPHLRARIHVYYNDYWQIDVVEAERTGVKLYEIHDFVNAQIVATEETLFALAVTAANALGLEVIE